MQVYLVGSGEVSGVDFVEAKCRQQPTGAQETCAVGCGVVLEAGGEAVSRELSGVGVSHHLVAHNLRVHDLANAVPVGEPHYKAVFRGVVLVLVLADEAFAGAVVSLALCEQKEMRT